MHSRRFYILDGRTVIPAGQWEWGLWSAHVDEAVKRVGYDKVGEIEVSTVFIGLDWSALTHSQAVGPAAPRVFETLVTSDDIETKDRSSTWEEAEAMHARWVEWARAEWRETVAASVDVITKVKDGSP